MSAPRVLIVDDEPLARQRLAALLLDIGAFKLVGECGNGRDAVITAQHQHAEIVLLDIRMPGMDGLEAARHLATLDPSPAVIFTTAYDDHALEAFEANAIDYLLKPIRAQRLEQALAKAHRLHGNQIEVLRDKDQRRTHIGVCQQGRSLELVAVNAIRYFQADQKYTSIGCAGQDYLIEESLTQLEQEFGQSFLRIHRNALVAMQYIQCLYKDDDGTWSIQLRDIPVAMKISRRHLREVRKRIAAATPE